VIVKVWNTPQGIPHRISAARRDCTFLAVKKIAVHALTRTRQAMIVYRYPKRSEAQPLMNRPIISPT
jgi:hypothetical protein